MVGVFRNDADPKTSIAALSIGASLPTEPLALRANAPLANSARRGYVSLDVTPRRAPRSFE
jgi:hypothetical protein